MNTEKITVKEILVDRYEDFNDYSLERMERYLIVGWNNGSAPVIV